MRAINFRRLERRELLMHEFVLLSDFREGGGLCVGKGGDGGKFGGEVGVSGNGNGWFFRGIVFDEFTVRSFKERFEFRSC